MFEFVWLLRINFGEIKFSCSLVYFSSSLRWCCSSWMDFRFTPIMGIKFFFCTLKWTCTQSIYNSCTALPKTNLKESKEDNSMIKEIKYSQRLRVIEILLKSIWTSSIRKLTPTMKKKKRKKSKRWSKMTIALI